MPVLPRMTEQQLSEWILRRLGAPLLRVELTQDHLTDNICDAKRWFAAKKGVRKNMIMVVHVGQSEYSLPDEVDVVLDVSFQVAPMDLSLIFSPFILIDDKVPYDVFAAPSSAGIYSSFVQTLQYVEQAKRILSAEPDWRQEDRKLYLFPVPRNETGVWVAYKTSMVTIEQLSERDYDLVRRYALARAKLDLAEVRGKYDSYPGAQGATTLNANMLIESANAELEKLEEEISLSGFPMGLMTG